MFLLLFDKWPSTARASAIAKSVHKLLVHKLYIWFYLESSVTLFQMTSYEFQKKLLSFQLFSCKDSLKDWHLKIKLQILFLYAVRFAAFSHYVILIQHFGLPLHILLLLFSFYPTLLKHLPFFFLQHPDDEPLWLCPTRPCSDKWETVCEQPGLPACSLSSYETFGFEVFNIWSMGNPCRQWCWWTMKPQFGVSPEGHCTGLMTCPGYTSPLGMNHSHLAWYSI